MDRYSEDQWPATEKILPIVRLWALRMLVQLGGHEDFINHDGFQNESLAKALGLGEYIEAKSRDFDRKKAFIGLLRRHEVSEAQFGDVKIPSILEANVQRLGEHIGLNATERRLLEFGILLNTEMQMEKASDILGDLRYHRLFRALSVLLNIPEKEIRLALRQNGVLSASGLLCCDPRGPNESCPLLNWLLPLSNEFTHDIISIDADPMTFLRNVVSQTSPAEIGLSDYGHIASSLSVARPFLKHAVAMGSKGVNFLFYGPPGTGKSQLAKILAKEAGCELLEVSSEDNAGNPISGHDRLSAFRAVQWFMNKRRSIIVFDEAEDAFNEGESYMEYPRVRTRGKQKGWFTRMLGENAIPTIWITNSIKDIDPAYIRRFDMVIELPVPPKKQRERIIHEACDGLLELSAISNFAVSNVLAPAVVTRAASVVKSIRAELGEVSASSAIELVIGNTLIAQGHERLRPNDPNKLPDIYDPAFIHASVDLAELAEGLVRSRSGRLCLYGPPGTGKTAYGRWMAEQLDIPLLIKRSSDLKSMWVGETEKNIAQAFMQAEREGALLLIDEVDSFLQDRRGAQRSWEVSEVNEMLTQMEAFPGVFIASTNLMEGIDQAALRRFDLKVKFDFLESKQACELFRRYCANLAIADPDDVCLAKLGRLHNLTPGDFAAAIRQSRFRPITSPAMLFRALNGECEVKETTKAIGFLH